MQQRIQSNFDALKTYEPELWRLGALAERYFTEDPNTSLLKLRQFSEILAQLLAARTGLLTVSGETQYDLIRRLSNEGAIPREVKQGRDHSVFQYIVTTTTQPPIEFQKQPWLRLELRGAPSTERLLRCDLP